MFCFHQQGHMKTHPVLTNVPAETSPATLTNDTVEDQSSLSANGNSGEQDEKERLAKSPEKLVTLEDQPITAGSGEEAEQPADTTE